MKEIIRIISALAAVCAPCAAPAASAAGEEKYKRDVLPLLSEFCYDCHGDGAHKGDLALDKFKSFDALLKDRKFWDGVREHVATHVMPPEKKPKPTVEQRDTIVNWIDDVVMAVDPSRPDPGHITLRRLNRAEYNNTVRDVFYSELKPAASFPADDAGYGFDNIGEVLSLSPMLMEKYLRAARQVSEDVVWMKGPERVERSSDSNDIRVVRGRGKNEEFATAIYTTGEAATEIRVDREGVYHLVMELAATQAGDTGGAEYAAFVDSKEVARGEIREPFDRSKKDRGWERITADARLGAGSHHFVVQFLNEGAEPANPNPLRRERHLLVRSISVRGPVSFEGGSQSKFCEWLFEGRKTRRPEMRLEGQDFHAGPQTLVNFSGEACIATNGYVHRKIVMPQDAEYRFRFLAAEDHAGNEAAKMRVEIDGKDHGVFDVTGRTGSPQEFTKAIRLGTGEHELRISFLNDFNGNGQDRNLHLREAVIEAPGEVLDPRSPLMTQRWIARLGLKMLRRPLDSDEAARLAQLAKVALDSGDDLTGAVRLVSEALLCSPKFLFRGGAKPAGAAEHGVVDIDEFSLASRLSYFLWSSCPDDELLQLASKSELRKNLPQQVRRMIGDWKARGLTENFAGQWLQLRDVGLVGPDQRRFPEFNGRLAYDMRRESELFFEHILRENRSALEFLDSDYSFVNDRLARYYGIKDVKGTEFRKVSLAGTGRGGILTQGSILTLTSQPTRTAPVKRGKFLLENILGTPPPPPPQNVPPLEDGKKGRPLVGTLRQRMEQHRADPTCASCHAFLDPVGFAFEHFDAVGHWRDMDNGQPIDASGQLVTGQKFDGAESLRKVLVGAKRKDFVRSLTENLLIFALGRGLDYNDKPFKDEIIRRAGENGDKFQEIILAVVESLPFQKMRAEEAKPVVGK